MSTNSILNPNLAPSGKAKIDWVKSYMPVLSSLEEEFRISKPFAGLKIAMSIHLEAKTAYLAMVLKSGGAEVAVTGCNPLSTQDDIAAALFDAGFFVHALHGASEERYLEDLIKTLSVLPDFIIDDGGDFVSLLHGSARDYAQNVKGG